MTVYFSSSKENYKIDYLSFINPISTPDFVSIEKYKKKSEFLSSRSEKYNPHSLFRLGLSALSFIIWRYYQQIHREQVNTESIKTASQSAPTPLRTAAMTYTMSH